MGGTRIGLWRAGSLAHRLGGNPSGGFVTRHWFRGPVGVASAPQNDTRGKVRPSHRRGIATRLPVRARGWARRDWIWHRAVFDPAPLLWRRDGSRALDTETNDTRALAA